jgi:hypothetical protein
LNPLAPTGKEAVFIESCAEALSMITVADGEHDRLGQAIAGHPSDTEFTEGMQQIVPSPYPFDETIASKSRQEI